jgi:hypothetical protein
MDNNEAQVIDKIITEEIGFLVGMCIDMINIGQEAEAMAYANAALAKACDLQTERAREATVALFCKLDHLLVLAGFVEDEVQEEDGCTMPGGDA